MTSHELEVKHIKFQVFTAVTMKNAVFWIWRRVGLVWTDVSEEGIASIFRVEKSASEEPAWAGPQPLSLQPPAQAGSSRADFSTLKMEAICSSETLVHTRYTRRHIPEDGILQEVKQI
jgi:hypothetical protein